MKRKGEIPEGVKKLCLIHEKHSKNIVLCDKRLKKIGKKIKTWFSGSDVWIAYIKITEELSIEQTVSK